MLAKRLAKMATWADPVPKLSGPLPTVDRIADMTESDAEQWLCGMRWPEAKPRCPKCGAERNYRIETRRRFKCAACYHQFTVLSGTAFASHKKSFRDLLSLMVYDGSGHTYGDAQSVTVYKTRRRMAANGN